MSVVGVGETVVVRQAAAGASPPPLRGPVLAESAPAFARVLAGYGRELEAGERLIKGVVHSARSSVSLGPGELIALQAGIYRYGQAVDLASRIIDRATTSIKTILQAQ
jgi:hypothetical protein